VARYHGKGGVVYMSTTLAGAATTVAHLSEWSLDMPADRVECTSFDDTNKAYVQGLADVSGSLSGFWDDTDDNMYDAMGSAGGVRLYLYPSKLVVAKYWYGTAYVDFSISTGSGGPITISGSFGAAGAWGQM